MSKKPAKENADSEKSRLEKRLKQLEEEKRRTIKHSGKVSIGKRIQKIKEMLESVPHPRLATS